MSKKRNFSSFMERVVGGKGFYIVLFACIAVIGVSAWILVLNDPSDTDGTEDYAPVMSDAGGTTLKDSFDVILPIIDDEKDADTEIIPPENGVGTMNPVEIPKIEVEPEPEVKKAPDPDPVPPEPNNESAGSGTVADPISFIWPLAGTVEVGYFPDSLIYDKTMGDWRTHNGVDIAAQIGTKVMAVAAGTVTAVYSDDFYGTVVEIDHGDSLVSIYANLAATPTVSEGDSVTMGSVIGSVGNTALAEMGEVSHLHFEMTKGDAPADPADYLPKR